MPYTLYLVALAFTDLSLEVLVGTTSITVEIQPHPTSVQIEVTLMPKTQLGVHSRYPTFEQGLNVITKNIRAFI